MLASLPRGPRPEVSRGDKTGTFLTPEWRRLNLPLARRCGSRASWEEE